MLPGFAVTSLLFHWGESQGSITSDFLPIRALSGFSKTLYHWHHLTFELETASAGQIGPGRVFTCSAVKVHVRIIDVEWIRIERKVGRDLAQWDGFCSGNTWTLLAGAGSPYGLLVFPSLFGVPAEVSSWFPSFWMRPFSGTILLNKPLSLYCQTL